MGDQSNELAAMQAQANQITDEVKYDTLLAHCYI